MQLFRNLGTFLVRFGHDVLHKKNELFPDRIIYLWNPKFKTFYYNFTFNVKDKVIEPSKVMTLSKVLCMIMFVSEMGNMTMQI